MLGSLWFDVRGSKHGGFLVGCVKVFDQRPLVSPCFTSCLVIKMATVEDFEVIHSIFVNIVLLHIEFLDNFRLSKP